MTEKELKKLSRTDLLRMLIAQSKQLNDLQEKYDQAQQQLSQRALVMERSGSIAEAALQLNGVFEAAQEACRQYTDSIALYTQQCERMEEDSRRKAQEILDDAQKRSAEMLRDAQVRTQKYWDDLLVKAGDYLANQEELQRLFKMTAQEKRL